MGQQNSPVLEATALWRNERGSPPISLPPSSSPAFSTLNHVTRYPKPSEPSRPSVLSILLPPATLRPLAFRSFTKKHNLNLTSSALQLLATFIGKHCGSGWREEGLAEKVLDEAAKQWKQSGGTLLVNGEGDALKKILGNLENTMDAGKLRAHCAPSGQGNFILGLQRNADEHATAHIQQLSISSRENSLGISELQLDETGWAHESKDPRRWLKVIDAFDQPRLMYNPNRKHFEAAGSSALIAGSCQKTQLFRQRYHLIHQRLLRNESFQTSAIARKNKGASQYPSSSTTTSQQPYKLTPIANLLGRGGSSHMLLGMLSISPSGLLTLNDLTGSIILDIQYARPSPEDGVWFTPGMIVVVDGQYEDEESKAGSSLDGNTGVGGSVGGIFLAFGMTGPPCEKRETTVGFCDEVKDGTHAAGAGFGWVDFLGVGSERAAGKLMRSLETQVLKIGNAETSVDGRGRIIILGEVNLDSTKTLQALRKVLAIYAAEPADQTPMTVVLMGNFVRYAAMAGGGSGGSIEYKEYFDALACALSDYPTMLQNTTFVFVPGDNDPWASAFSAGAAAAIPKSTVPDVFTSRIRRAFATANSEAGKAIGKKLDGGAIWSTNPTRLSLFGPSQEIVLFRDDISGRLRRNAIRFRPEKRDSMAKANDNLQGAKGEDMVPEGHPQQVSRTDEAMDIDPEVEATASHIPGPKARALETSGVFPDSRTARKLVKTVLDQGYLSPFPLSQRPVLWDHAGSLQLYPLPTALVLMDTEAPAFAVGLEGCHVMNPGSLTSPFRKGVAQWMEYNIRIRRGKVKEARY
ncbi:MAG: hypothetical protein Q9163_005200 [Psora crenata]